MKVTAAILSGAVGRSAVELYSDFQDLAELKVRSVRINSKFVSGLEEFESRRLIM